MEWTERVIKKMEAVGMFDDMVKHQEVLNSGDVKMTISWIFNNLKRYYSNLDETEVERALIEADKVAFRQNEPMDDLNRQIEQDGYLRDRAMKYEQCNACAKRHNIHICIYIYIFVYMGLIFCNQYFSN